MKTCLPFRIKMAPSVVIGSHGDTEPQRDGLPLVVPLAHTDLTTLMLLRGYHEGHEEHEGITEGKV